MKRYIRSSTDLNTIKQLVIDDVDSMVRDAADDGLGFWDGDVYAYAIDEVVRTGSVSEIAAEIQDILADDPSREDELDDIGCLIADCNSQHTLYSMSDIVNLFKSHGKFQDMPDWYFE